MRSLCCLAALLCFATSTFAQDAPQGDFHQHLLSPATVDFLSGPGTSSAVRPITAADLIRLLDDAGIRRALILSMAYTWANPGRIVADEYEKVKAENDWTSQQVALYPGRLEAFCSLNPLKSYALAELNRCARDPQLRRGLKLHLGNSAVDYHNPEHVERVRAVFRAASRHRMPIVVHMRASFSQQLAYGADEAKIFFDEWLPQAQNVPVQIAHLAGAGGADDVAAESALEVLLRAVERKDPRTKRLYFDVTTVVQPGMTPEQAARVVGQLRRIGMQRVLYGSDAAAPGNLAPREGWAEFRKLPLTEAEFRRIANNVPPYFR